MPWWQKYEWVSTISFLSVSLLPGQDIIMRKFYEITGVDIDSEIALIHGSA
jgi:hypothetical protein